MRWEVNLGAVGAQMFTGGGRKKMNNPLENMGIPGLSIQPFLPSTNN